MVFFWEEAKLRHHQEIIVNDRLSDYHKIKPVVSLDEQENAIKRNRGDKPINRKVKESTRYGLKKVISRGTARQEVQN